MDIDECFQKVKSAFREQVISAIEQKLLLYLKKTAGKPRGVYLRIMANNDYNFLMPFKLVHASELDSLRGKSYMLYRIQSKNCIRFSMNINELLRSPYWGIYSLV